MPWDEVVFTCKVGCVHHIRTWLIDNHLLKVHFLQCWRSTWLFLVIIDMHGSNAPHGAPLLSWWCFFLSPDHPWRRFPYTFCSLWHLCKIPACELDHKGTLGGPWKVLQSCWCPTLIYASSHLLKLFSHPGGAHSGNSLPTCGRTSDTVSSASTHGAGHRLIFGLDSGPVDRDLSLLSWRSCLGLCWTPWLSSKVNYSPCLYVTGQVYGSLGADWLSGLSHFPSRLWKYPLQNVNMCSLINTFSKQTHTSWMMRLKEKVRACSVLHLDWNSKNVLQ